MLRSFFLFAAAQGFVLAFKKTYANTANLHNITLNYKQKVQKRKQAPTRLINGLSLKRLFFLLFFYGLPSFIGTVHRTAKIAA